MIEIILIAGAIILVYLIVSFLFGRYGPQDSVIGLNIKSGLKKDGFNIYGVASTVWRDIGDQANQVSERIIAEKNDGAPIDVYYSQHLNLDKMSDDNTIKLRVIEHFVKFIGDTANGETNDQDAQELEEVFNRHGSSIYDLLQ